MDLILVPLFADDDIALIVDIVIAIVCTVAELAGGLLVLADLVTLSPLGDDIRDLTVVAAALDEVLIFIADIEHERHHDIHHLVLDLLLIDDAVVAARRRDQFRALIRDVVRHDRALRMTGHIQAGAVRAVMREHIFANLLEERNIRAAPRRTGFELAAACAGHIYGDKVALFRRLRPTGARREFLSRTTAAVTDKHNRNIRLLAFLDRARNINIELAGHALDFHGFVIHAQLIIGSEVTQCVNISAVLTADAAQEVAPEVIGEIFAVNIFRTDGNIQLGNMRIRLFVRRRHVLREGVNFVRVAVADEIVAALVRALPVVNQLIDGVGLLVAGNPHRNRHFTLHDVGSAALFGSPLLKNGGIKMIHAQRCKTRKQLRIGNRMLHNSIRRIAIANHVECRILCLKICALIHVIKRRIGVFGFIRCPAAFARRHQNDRERAFFGSRLPAGLLKEFDWVFPARNRHCHFRLAIFPAFRNILIDRADRAALQRKLDRIQTEILAGQRIGRINRIGFGIQRRDRRHRRFRQRVGKCGRQEQRRQKH